MKARSRLVQNIDRLSRSPPGKLRRQLDPLGLAAGKLRRRLPQLNIGKSHVVERLDLAGDGRHVFKEFQRLLHRHVQNVINALSLIFDLQGLPVVPLSAADLAGNIHIRQKVHLDLDDPVSAAGLAPAALDVKAEPALGIASGLGVRRRGEQVPDQVKHPRIGRRIGAGRPPDGGLVDGDDLIQLFHPVDSIMLSRNSSGPV